MKEAKVIPVHKSNDETEPGNYRPISLLSIFNWIFEKLMYHRLRSFLDKNSILFKSQYGFHEKHSTQHTILDTVNIIQNNMDLKLFTCGNFIDLEKAFDTLTTLFCCKNLITKASGASLMMLSSYLLGRSQVTEVDTFLSSKVRFLGLAGLICSTLFHQCVVPENIHTPPRMVLPIRPPPTPSEFPFQRGHV